MENSKLQADKCYEASKARKPKRFWLAEVNGIRPPIRRNRLDKSFEGFGPATAQSIGPPPRRDNHPPSSDGKVQDSTDKHQRSKTSHNEIKKQGEAGLDLTKMIKYMQDSAKKKIESKELLTDELTDVLTKEDHPPAEFAEESPSFFSSMDKQEFSDGSKNPNSNCGSLNAITDNAPCLPADSQVNSNSSISKDGGGLVFCCEENKKTLEELYEYLKTRCAELTREETKLRKEMEDIALNLGRVSEESAAVFVLLNKLKVTSLFLCED
jgi:hypothetical protein